MNKKIFLATLIISLVILAGFIGSIVYSANKISYNVTGSQTTPHIGKSAIFPFFTGYLEVKTDINLANKGYYNIKNLQIDLSVYAYNWTFLGSPVPKLNGNLVGTGTNNIGTIKSQSAYVGPVIVNITKDIPSFAVDKCDLKIVINIHLVYQPVIDFPYSYSTLVYKVFTPPF